MKRGIVGVLVVLMIAGVMSLTSGLSVREEAVSVREPSSMATAIPYVIQDQKTEQSRAEDVDALVARVEGDLLQRQNFEDRDLVELGETRYGPPPDPEQLQQELMAEIDAEAMEEYED